MLRNLDIRRTVLVLISALLLGGPARGAMPEVVGHVPADAQMAVVVPNLAALAAKLPEIEPGDEGTNAVAALALDAVIGQGPGVRMDGGLVVVSKGLGFTENPATTVIIVPISDFDALAGSFQNVVSDQGDLRRATGYGSVTQELYLRPLGGYAVVSTDRAWAQSIQTANPSRAQAVGDQLGPGGRAALEQGHLSFYFNLEALNKTVGVQLPYLRPLMAEQTRQEVQLGLVDANEAMMQNVFQNAMLDMGIAILRDGRGAMFGLMIGDDRLELTVDMQMKPDSPLGKDLVGGSDKPLLLNRLPALPYMMAMSTDLSSLPIDAWVRNLQDRVPSDNPYGRMLQHVAKLAPHRGGVVQHAWYVPSEETRDVMANVVVAESPNATAFIDTFADSAAAPNGWGMHVEYTERVMLSGEKHEYRIDHLDAGINIPASGLAHYGTLAMLITHGYSGYATTARGALILSSEPSQPLVDAAIASSGGSGAMDQSSGVAELRSTMPPHRVVEGYVNLAGAFEFLRGHLVRVDRRIEQIQLPTGLPPTAFSLSVHDSNVLGKVQAPQALLRELVFALMQLKSLEAPVHIEVQ
ncbi:MAG: hypothetical protein CMJ49_11780 [Planctomycetaceae bacterium]|nr:hypothetical protein [Planctomycetaceae bacterium]